MNNPFHRAALKAFATALDHVDRKACPLATFEEIRRAALPKFEASLEAQARAFDACKSGTEISMKTLQHEMLKAFYLAKARVKIDGDWAAAERVFNDHMKPHLEIRLW